MIVQEQHSRSSALRVTVVEPAETQASEDEQTGEAGLSAQSPQRALYLPSSPSSAYTSSPTSRPSSAMSLARPSSAMSVRSFQAGMSGSFVRAPSNSATYHATANFGRATSLDPRHHKDNLLSIPYSHSPTSPPAHTEVAGCVPLAQCLVGEWITWLWGGH